MSNKTRLAHGIGQARELAPEPFCHNRIVDGGRCPNSGCRLFPSPALGTLKSRMEANPLKHLSWQFLSSPVTAERSWYATKNTTSRKNKALSLAPPSTPSHSCRRSYPPENTSGQRKSSVPTARVSTTEMFFALENSSVDDRSHCPLPHTHLREGQHDFKC